jgi:hypothetical protein
MTIEEYVTRSRQSPGNGTWFPICDRCEGALGANGEVIPKSAEITLNLDDSCPTLGKVRVYQTKAATNSAALKAGWNVDGDVHHCPNCAESLMAGRSVRVENAQAERAGNLNEAKA